MTILYVAGGISILCLASLIVFVCWRVGKWIYDAGNAAYEEGKRQGRTELERAIIYNEGPNIMLRDLPEVSQWPG